MFKKILNKGEVRLNKYISNAGICSRREADKLIKEGKITVNGKVVREVGTKISYKDKVYWDEQKIQPQHKVYLVLNKPKGFMTTVKDTEHPKHVSQLVKMACKERIYPVGSMDTNATGLLFFTNDGELTKKLTQNELDKERIFQVTLDKELSEEDEAKLLEGIRLKEGVVKAENIGFLKSDTRFVLGISLKNGFHRVVPRMFQPLGYKVLELDCVLFGGITKKNIRRGHWRMLTETEVRMLKFF